MRIVTRNTHFHAYFAKVLLPYFTPLTYSFAPLLTFVFTVGQKKYKRVEIPPLGKFGLKVTFRHQKALIYDARKQLSVI